MPLIQPTRGAIIMETMDKQAVEKIESLRNERDYYKAVADLLQEALQERDDEFKALKGQYSLLLRDYKMADVG